MRLMSLLCAALITPIAFAAPERPSAERPSVVSPSLQIQVPQVTPNHRSPLPSAQTDQATVQPAALEPGLPGSLVKPEDGSTPVAVPIIAEKPDIAALQSSPDRLPNIAKTVHLLLSSKKVSFADHPSDNDIGLAFLGTIDPYRLFFTDTDITGLLKDTSGLKKAIQGDDLGWVFGVFDLYETRQSQRLKDAMAIIDVPMDLEAPGSWTMEVSDWPNQRAQDERWRLSVRDDIVSAILEGATQEAAIAELKKSYEKSASTITGMSDLKRVEIFLRSYAHRVDPHSTYLAPSSKDSFNAMVHNSYEGIGVVWQQTNDGVAVMKTHPNSPAAAADLPAGARLLGVGATGMATSVVDVQSWSLEEVVALMRGPVETSVLLRIMDPNGQTVRDVVLERTTITLNESVVTHKIVSIPSQLSSHPEGYKVAVITIPAFYQDAANPNRPGGSAHMDVRRIIETMAKEKQDIRAIVLDLRGNGGGVMSEAIQLVGTFVRRGVVLQLKTVTGESRPTWIEQGAVMWNGPLAVLIDENSASASEITAAALQDNARAIVLGRTSYGKGTAQTMMDLDEMAELPISIYGQVNLTSMMFYRPSGDSTQLKGVRPDVIIPMANQSQGESQFSNAIPFDSLPSAVSYATTVTENPWQSRRRALQMSSEQRVAQSFWYPHWLSLQSLPAASESTRSLVLSERQAAHSRQALQAKIVEEAWTAEGAHLNDGLGADVVLREALHITQDAFKF